MGTAEELKLLFPRLAIMPHQVIGGADPRYNCIAWAAGDTLRYWWPEPHVDAHWPVEPREETVAAIVRVFEGLGYGTGTSVELEAGFEKIAIYAIELDDPEAEEELRPTHVARQLPDGSWTSKLGRSVLLAHTLEALEGPHYGSVVQVMRRPISPASG